MKSLPERLRSLALSRADDTAGTCREAADELDRRAEEIQRLGYKLRRISELAGPPGAWPPDPERIVRDTLRSYASEIRREPLVRVVSDPDCPPGLLIAVAPDGTVTVRRA